VRTAQARNNPCFPLLLQVNVEVHGPAFSKTRARVYSLTTRTVFGNSMALASSTGLRYGPPWWRTVCREKPSEGTARGVRKHDA
jgi:hypothetical protein